MDTMDTVELNGINVIDAKQRKGRSRQLFFPWFAGNITVFGLSYGAFVLGFGISFWQAAIAVIVGTVVSYFLCGLISIAGKRGSAPTMTLSRATFGVRGNALPTLVSWMLCVGWETILMSLAALAAVTLFGRLGWGSGTGVKVGAFLVVAAVTIAAAVWGFRVVMRLFTVITVATGVLSIGYFVLTVDKVHWSVISQTKPGPAAAVLGACVLIMTGEGLGWVNTAADYSRYLPRSTSNWGIAGWPIAGGSLAAILTVGYGLFLAGSSSSLSNAIGINPIGALTTLLPTWYLVPFGVVVLLGLVGSAVMELYSSGLSLLTMGLRTPRYVASAIDGVVMMAGSIYVVFFAHNFIAPFEGFLITLGVAITAWCGVFLADLALRRHDYTDSDLYRSSGRYGGVQPISTALFVAATVVGFGLVVNTSLSWLKWQGFLLSPLGLGGRNGAWASTDIGVLVAFGIGFVGWFILGRAIVRRQEEAPSETATADTVVEAP
jgi:NCS1 family nucleobase:cation symporter-1